MRFAATMALSLTLGLLALAGGCRSGQEESPPLPVFGGGINGVELKPEWKDFALKNYRGQVLADLPPIARDTSLFPKPQVIASRAPDGSIDLLVAGTVNSRSIEGHGVKREYTVLWRQAGSGWSLVDAHSSEPMEYQLPPEKPEPSPAMQPKTKPATAPQ